MKTIRVGSRESRLATVQARLVMDAIQAVDPDIRLELVTMKTTGDKILDRPLESVGGKGLFTRELDDALANGRVDICVHSYKDLPVPGHPELPVLAAFRREDPRDVLVLPAGRSEPEPDPAKPIGTSSPRRQCQAAGLFPGREFKPVRGNVLTRLAKLDAGDYSALILAAAGLKRLGLWNRASRVFEPEEMLPSACQGILAVQGRAGGDYSYLTAIDDADARDAAAAERAFVEALGATCASPVAAHAMLNGKTLTLTGLYVTPSGAMLRRAATGPRSEASRLGRELARELLNGKDAP